MGCDRALGEIKYLTAVISIHAPRVGCDCHSKNVNEQQKDFNPRTPCGVRPRCHWRQCSTCRHFNPRTPCGVRHRVRHSFGTWFFISIHVPPVGCDFIDHCGMMMVQDFNPRTPCGVRPDDVGEGNYQCTFQSTHPVWGATVGNSRAVQKDSTFQSTHPVWGATKIRVRDFPHFSISIHAPRVGCDEHVRTAVPAAQGISIHAPRVGCDSMFARPYRPRKEFQSTHPVWGATHQRLGAVAPRGISIHAPRVGCDLKTHSNIHKSKYFNPRTPCGVRHEAEAVECIPFSNFNPRTPCGVRPGQQSRHLLASHFNPRTPCGVRRVIEVFPPPCTVFQSTHPVWGATQGS